MGRESSAVMTLVTLCGALVSCAGEACRVDFLCHLVEQAPLDAQHTCSETAQKLQLTCRCQPGWLGFCAPMLRAPSLTG